MIWINKGMISADAITQDGEVLYILRIDNITNAHFYEEILSVYQTQNFNLLSWITVYNNYFRIQLPLIK